MNRRLVVPLLLSALVHLGLALWLGRTASPPPPLGREAPAPLTVELAFHEAPEALPRPPPPRLPPPAPVPRPRAVVRAAPPAAPPTPAAPEAPAAPLVAQAPAAEDVPRRAPGLVPSWVQTPAPAAGSLPVGPESRGRTLRPGDAALAPESRQEEAERLTARVQTWADDDMARERARGIGAHPYLEDVRHTFEGALARADGGTPQQLGIQNPLAGLVKNYADAAEEYGRTGSPGHAPPSLPLHSEQLAARFRDEPAAQRLIGAAQARETFQALENRGALLTVKLELRHSPAGALLGARVAQGSGNRLFDAFVLKAVPASLGALPPPPLVVLHGQGELRTQWLVEGWHHPPRKLAEALASSLGSGQLMLPLGLLTGLDDEDVPGFEYRARLIGLY